MVYPDVDQRPDVSFSYRRVLIRWERLRLVYNVLMLVVAIGTAAWVLAPPGTYTGGPFLKYFAYRAVQANILFCAGPAVDLAVSWLGLRSRVVTGVLFGCGTVVSIFLTHLSVTFYIMMLND